MARRPAGRLTPVADAGLRDLERRWRETGLLADRVLLLRERVRQGALGRHRLNLAAYVGDPAALEASGNRPAQGRGIEAWLEGLLSWGAEAKLRADLAVARRVIADSRGECPHPPRVLEALQAWVEDPTDQRRAEVRAAGRALRACVDDHRGVLYEDELCDHPGTVTKACSRLLRSLEVPGFSVLAWGDRRLPDREELRAAVRAVLVPWALGEGRADAPSLPSDRPRAQQAAPLREETVPDVGAQPAAPAQPRRRSEPESESE